MPFVSLLKAVDVPVGAGAFAEARGVPVAVFNAGGGCFYACGALCPHEDGPLSDGWLEAQTAVCPWHGFSFELTTGLCTVDPDLAVAVYPTRVVGAMVEVDLP